MILISTCGEHLRYILGISIISKLIHFIFANKPFLILKQVFLFIVLLMSFVYLQAQLNVDSAALKQDTAHAIELTHADKYKLTIDSAFYKSKFLNSGAKPLAFESKEVNPNGSDKLFYFLLGLVIVLAFLKVFFDRYFNSLFQVFFNTSLRQSQLTDQLLQAKQASLLFNLLFALTAGAFTYLVLKYFNWQNDSDALLLISICGLLVAVIYIIKYITLKTTGWLTGYAEPADTYLFIIFLVNKILGIILIPFTIVIAFSPDFLKQPVVIISLLIVGFMFLLRFIRSYSLLHNQIRVSRFHFFLYIAGIEVLPVLLVYKGALILLGKNG